MRKWISDNQRWLLAAAMLVLFDIGTSSLAACVGGEQQQAAKCAEEGYGLLNSITVRTLFWFIGLVDDNSDFFQAASAVVVAIFTVTLWRTTTGLLKAAHEQSVVAENSAIAAHKATETASAEFIASHRPRLRIRSVVFNTIGGPADSDPIAYYVPGEHVTGQIAIHNVGGTRADILDGCCMVFWTAAHKGLPMVPPYEARGDDLKAETRTLLSGQNTVARFTSDNPMGDEGLEIQSPSGEVSPGPRIFVMGSVRYADRNNDIWRTAFCREFKVTHESPSGRFYAVTDPDYESEG